MSYSLHCFVNFPGCKTCLREATTRRRARLPYLAGVSQRYSGHEGWSGQHVVRLCFDGAGRRSTHSDDDQTDCPHHTPHRAPDNGHRERSLRACLVQNRRYTHTDLYSLQVVWRDGTRRDARSQPVVQRRQANSVLETKILKILKFLLKFL